MQHVLIALIEMLVNAQVMNLVFLDVEFLIVGLYCLGMLQKVYHTPIFARIVIQRQDIIITLLVGGSVFENCGVFVVGGFEDDGNLTVPDLHKYAGKERMVLRGILLFGHESILESLLENVVCNMAVAHHIPFRF